LATAIILISHQLGITMRSHARPSRSSPAGSRHSQIGPPLIQCFLSRLIRANVIKFSYPALNPQDAAKDKWFISEEFRLSNEKKPKMKYPNQQ